MTNIEKIKANDIEIVNNDSKSDDPKITKINADDKNTYQKQQNTQTNAKNPLEEMIKKMQEQQGNTQNPISEMMGNVEEIKKIKSYFFISILCGIIGLFTLREFFGPAGILAGVADLYLGSKLTQTPAKFGIFLGLVDLVLYFS